LQIMVHAVALISYKFDKKFFIFCSSDIRIELQLNILHLFQIKIFQVNIK
jgi:hypothetical protein